MADDSRLVALGYRPIYVTDSDTWPSMTYRKLASNGYWACHLIFDTIHGGTWTFETSTSTFVRNEEYDWTPQELREFDPSTDFTGANKGHWVKDMSILDADELSAISDFLNQLERERKSRCNEG